MPKKQDVLNLLEDIATAICKFDTSNAIITLELDKRSIEKAKWELSDFKPVNSDEFTLQYAGLVYNFKIKQ